MYSNYIKLRIELQLKFIIICTLHIRSVERFDFHSLSLTQQVAKFIFHFANQLNNVLHVVTPLPPPFFFICVGFTCESSDWINFCNP